MLTQFFSSVFAAASGLSLEISLYICWGAFAAVFLGALLLTVFNGGVRAADKRPYLALVNVFSVVTFALALTEKPFAFCAMLAAAFWCVGYLTYGLIVLLSRRRPRRAGRAALRPAPPREAFPVVSCPPANANVRTEHALSVTQKLLEKDLGRGDRQETERIKTAIDALKAKGALTPEDNARLNDNFNTLLKLMAKYNV